jgi:hypothetical protein
MAPREFLGAKPAVKVGTVGLWHGTGSPEGAVTAPVGDIFMRTDGGAGTTYYVKESGSGNTGWKAHESLQGAPIQRGGTILTPTSAVDITIWRAPYACTVTAVKGWRTGGTGATINARKNQTSDHLASDLSLTSSATWMDGGSVQNTAYAAGDSLEIRLRSAAGSPSYVTIQVELTRP